jgi:hypothetical protein
LIVRKLSLELLEAFQCLMPNGTTVPLPSALVLGQVVRARQNFGGATSNWSAPVTVRDHNIDYPTGPPRPEIEPAPVYKYGSRTGVNNLLTGCKLQCLDYCGWFRSWPRRWRCEAPRCKH